MSPSSQTPFHIPSHPPFQIVTEPLSEFPESYCKFPLAIYFTYGIVNFHVNLSTHLTLSLLPSPHVLRSVFCLFLRCCPENKFISTIFLDSMYMHQYTISIFLFLLTSCCIIVSRFIHLIRPDSNVFLLMAEQHSIVCMHHSFFIHSSVNGHLDCFHVLATLNSAATNIGIHVSFSVLVSSGYMPNSGTGLDP